MRRACKNCKSELVQIYEPFPIEQTCWIHVDSGLEQCRIEDKTVWADPADEIGEWESEGGRAL